MHGILTLHEQIRTGELLQPPRGIDHAAAPAIEIAQRDGVPSVAS